MVRRLRAATGGRQLCRQGPAQEAVRRIRIEQALDTPPPAPASRNEPAVDPREAGAGKALDVTGPGQARGEGLQLQL